MRYVGRVGCLGELCVWMRGGVWVRGRYVGKSEVCG